MALKCPGCGSIVSAYDKVCSYCGSNNAAYRSMDKETAILMSEGIESFKKEEYAAAVRCFLQVIELAPDALDAHFYLSACHNALGRPQEAIKSMEWAQMLRPGSAAIYHNLGVLSKYVGRREDAKNYLEKALVVAKTDTAIPDRAEFENRVTKELEQLK